MNIPERTLTCSICQGAGHDVACDGDSDFWDPEAGHYRYPPCEYCEGRGWIPRPPPGLFAQALTRTFTELLPEREDPVAAWAIWLDVAREDCDRWMRDDDIPPADTLMRILTIMKDMRGPLADDIRANLHRVCNARIRTVTRNGSACHTLGWYALGPLRQAFESALYSLADGTEQEHVLTVAIKYVAERRDAIQGIIPKPHGGA